MKNPFEEKRKNDRINKLVKENQLLKDKLEKVEDELESANILLSACKGALSIKEEECKQLLGVISIHKEQFTKIQNTLDNAKN